MDLDIITILKFLSMLTTTIFAVIGITTDYKRQDKVTKWGRLAIIGVLLSTLLSGILLTFEQRNLARDRKKAEEDKVASQQWTKDAKRSLLKDGSYAQRTSHFRAEIAARARELLGRAAIPGADYVLTEIVHCKSREEVGVREARDECASRYLRRVLECAAAKVIVVLGRQAAKTVRGRLNIPNRHTMWGPNEIYGISRVLIFMPHPSAFGPRKFSRHLSEGALNRVRSFLHSA